MKNSKFSDDFMLTDTTASQSPEKKYHSAHEKVFNQHRQNDSLLAEHVLMQNATEDFLIATADASTASGEEVKKLLQILRKILGMDIVFVAELIDGRKIYRHLDRAITSNVAVEIGTSAASETTLCQRVIDGRAPQFMNDVQLDRNLADLATVKSMKIGAYLSIPVVFRDGSTYGTLCCISHQARSAIGSRQLDSLKHVAKMVSREIEKNREVSKLKR